MALVGERMGVAEIGKTGDQSAEPVEQVQDDLCESWNTYNFGWLYDPDRFDHLPIEEQLKLYKQRDLSKAKTYKFAARIWGAPPSRRRRIFARSMETSGEEESQKPRLGQLHAAVKPPTKPEVGSSPEEVRAREEREKIESYKNWVKERKAFRSGLERMGLSQEWLARKPNKTALEQRVLMRQIQENQPRIQTPEPELDEPVEAEMADDNPVARRPSPYAIRIIEKFLRQKKMRLIDLFKRVDKNKNWKVSREEFKKAVQEANIPVSEVLLEELILALDTDLNDQLDYRELAKGMGLWRIEKRQSKKKLLSSTELRNSPRVYSQLSGFESPDRPKEKLQLSPVKTKSFENSVPLPSEQNGDKFTTAGRVRSALSTISSQSTPYLELPEKDLRPEQLVLGSEEAMVDLRKRDREALARLQGKKLPNTKAVRKKKPVLEDEIRLIVKTGDAAIDGHMQASTLEGDTSKQVEKFRQLRLNEYHVICKLCKDNDVPFTEDLLKKGLLFPPDKPHSLIKKQIRQPAVPPQDTAFTKSAKRPKTPVEVHRKVPPKSTKAKTASIIRKHGYPPGLRAPPAPRKVVLSTGRATIARRVNCWMTFDEYERITSNLSKKYTQLHGHSDDNAFWPGHLLDKMRLCMPDDNSKNSSVFSIVKQPQRTNVGYHNDLQTWPVSESGYVQYGSIDPYINKY